MIRSKNFDAVMRRKLLEDGARLCFLGIGGISMYALTMLCHTRGLFVFGADRVESDRTRALRAKGIRVFVPSAGAAVDSATAVVCSLALDEENEDILRARSLGIPIFTRGELLGTLMEDYTVSIAVSGSHGKSTVTAALSSALTAAEKAPTVLAGAALPESSESYRIGQKDYLVAESCEYGDSFLSLRPSLALFLNLEWDHPDYFSSEAMLMRSFARAAMRSGVVLYSSESPLLARLVDAYGLKNAISVGIGEEDDFRYELVRYENACATIRFFYKKDCPITLSLAVPGRFQAQNAAMVLAALSYIGIPQEIAVRSLSSFGGIARRLSLLRTYDGGAVYYDYAHHPSEIRAGIETLRDLHGAPVTVLFRPHTFSRTAALFSDFVSALSAADRVLITDIDGVRETEKTVSAEALAEAVGGEYVPLAHAAERVMQDVWGTVVLMGAGDFSAVLSALPIK